MTSGFSVFCTEREIATLNAALGEYLYILEEGDMEDFVASTELLIGLERLDLDETIKLRSKLEQAVTPR